MCCHMRMITFSSYSKIMMYGVSMQAGLLNRQIEVYKPITLTNAVGSQSIKWTKMFETRASVRQAGMNRGQQVNEIFYPTTKEFIIRSYHSYHVLLSLASSSSLTQSGAVPCLNWRYKLPYLCSHSDSLAGQCVQSIRSRQMSYRASSHARRFRYSFCCASQWSPSRLDSSLCWRISPLTASL